MNRTFAILLVIAAAALTVMGLVMLFSASAYHIFTKGEENYENFFIRRQLFALVVGLVFCVAAAAINYRTLEKLAWPILGFCVVLLVLCYVPGFGRRINDSARWITLHLPGLTNLQPSEFAKLGLALFIAFWYQRLGSKEGSLLHGVLLPGLVAAVPCGLVIFQTDLGNALLMASFSICLMFIGGAPIRFLLPILLIVVMVGGFVILNSPERRARVDAFFNPDEHARGDAMQQLEGIKAIGSGGINGVGLAKSRQKMAYVPYAHTDFIFTIVGEELGLRATLGVVFAFLILAVSGTAIAVAAPDRLGQILGMGATLIVTMQAAINLGVTTQLLPNKGLPLPFMSYGGSNLIVSLVCVGLLLSIHRRSRGQAEAEMGTVLNVRIEPPKKRRPRKRPGTPRKRSTA